MFTSDFRIHDKITFWSLIQQQKLCRFVAYPKEFYILLNEKETSLVIQDSIQGHIHQCFIFTPFAVVVSGQI